MRAGIVGRRSWLSVALACVASLFFDSVGVPHELHAAAPSEAVGEELFQAITDGKVEARVVVRDQFHARVFLKNVTQSPVSVKLPDVLAARPILAQNFFNPGANPGQGFGPPASSSTQGASQAVGGSPNGTARPNGIFSIPPESVREMRLETVCLEHGKPNPRSAVKYELVKLEEVCKEPAVEALLVRYAQGGLDRDTVQAAAWNLANGLAWRDLENMTEPVAINASRPVYSTEQLQAARRLTGAAKKQIAARTAPSEKSITVEGQTIDFSTINARK